MDKLLTKALSTGISLGGGLLAAKVFEFTWRQITGEDAPKNTDDDSIELKKALIFAISSAAISASVQVLSRRGAAAGVRKIRG